MAKSTRSALFGPLSLLPSGGAASASTKIPSFLYGCAWKQLETEALVYKAINSGFRGIDVAAQPRHYREDLAGAGLRRVYAEGKIKRGDLFVQTKYSPPAAHSPGSAPYDPNAPIAAQVTDSVRSSLHNLRHSGGPSGVSPSSSPSPTDAYIDALVLHSPLRTFADTLTAWRAMSSFVMPGGIVRFLGISNVTLPVLSRLFTEADVKPAIVQNRFHGETGFDGPVRRFCRDNGIVYQAFWTLTANPGLLRSGPVVELAGSAGVGREVALYALAMALEDVIVLNGTKSHMTDDLEGIEKVAEHVRQQGQADVWEEVKERFRQAIGDTSM